MSRLWQLFFCVAALAVAASAFAQTNLSAGVAGARVAVMDTNLLPPTPVLQSPVTYFRELLLMTPAERAKSLSSRTRESRAVLTGKIREYLSFSPEERELRLEATELRWYLTPMLSMKSAADRDARLAQIPTNMLPLVKSRLRQWDLMPPQMQAEILANDKTISYVAHMEILPPTAVDPEQQKTAKMVDEFFSLKPWEQKHVLNTLSEAERTQMEKTLRTFDQLSLQERELCIRNYVRFAGLTGDEREEFLKNAEHWSRMSARERQAWRDLVSQVQLLPPVPPSPAPKNSKDSIATNKGS